jgi:hypothetical protein
MPTFDPGKTWTAQDLREACQAGTVALQPFICSTFRYLRAADGVGSCNLLTDEAEETQSVAFAFETGEVWAIDTWLLGTHPSELFIGELERWWTVRLAEYATFLQRLGLQAPYRWIAGVTGVKNRWLQLPLPPGQMMFPGSRGPECLADEIIIEGSYDGEQLPISALLPFFDAIYHKCGMRRPDYLPR